jgi:large subunit ribosomal protein L18
MGRDAAFAGPSDETTMAMKIVGRERRKLRIRKKVTGTPERPRLSVFRSSRHIYAQVIDDVGGATLAYASTLSKDLKGSLEEDNKVDAAKKVGALIAKICKSKKIDRVVFDRNGYMYHGRVQALAQAARDAGLDF